jgi:alpha-aminoadipate carrier protein LysW
MKKTQCPACKSDVILDDDAYMGDILDCANCESELEIISLNPPALQETGGDEYESIEEENEEG